MPSSQWHPARGRDGYAPLVKTLSKNIARKRGGEAACPVVTTIGIGFQLDSELLLNFSETFLHMPDPGQIGPFIVNLLAAVRSTARLPEPSAGRAANACALVITPAAALVEDAECAPGYASDLERIVDDSGADAVKVRLGAILYDQPRHLVIKTQPGASVTVALQVGGATIATAESDAAPAASDADAKQAAVELLRAEAIVALREALSRGVAAAPAEEVSAPLRAFVARLRASAVASQPAVRALGNTIEKECLLGCNATNFERWGAHYFRTLPCMLKAERRSNFRDECMAHFGRDARGREALFETQSNEAEMRFATLKPPEPSLLRPQPTVIGTAVGSGGVAGGPPPPTASALPPRPVMALPDEFMRGGGCFGPRSTVRLATAGGGTRAVPVSEVCAGDVLVGEGGTRAAVRCVVLTECAGGRAMLTRLPNGTEITEWHPVRMPSGRWRFPQMLGQRVVVHASHVYNFVLEAGHPTVLVGGVPCAALGHGLSEPIVAHSYWGTRAVIDDLMCRDGWAAGRVVLPAAAEA